jgi:hypothetical protein
MVAIRTLPVILLALLLGAISADAGSTQGVSDNGDGGTCGDPSSGNFWEGTARPEECRLLREFPDLARREGNRLIISLVSGEPRIFMDRGECWVEDCVSYILGLIKRDSDVVIVWKPPLEGTGAVLLDRRSGEVLEVDDFPEASADRRYWAVVDGGAAFGSGIIQVLRHEEGRFQTVGEMYREFCLFKNWEEPPSFLVLCYDRPAEATKEYRVVPDDKSGFALTETGRALGPDEDGFPF